MNTCNLCLDRFDYTAAVFRSIPNPRGEFTELCICSFCNDQILDDAINGKYRREEPSGFEKWLREQESDLQ